MHQLIPACACACAVSAAAASVQPDLVVFASDRGGNYELYSMALDGSGAAPLTHDPTFDSFWGKPSPDGSRILFYRAPQGVADSDYGRTSLWRINSDGSGLVQVRAVGADGWTIQGHAEWSPDGRSIATIGTAGGVLQIFVVDADGLHPRQVTTAATNVIDCSWSPDGLSLLVVSTPVAGGARGTQEVYRVPAAGGAPIRLTSDLIEDYDPYYSPDGARIAWLSQTSPDVHGPGLGAWNIRIMDADGSHVGLITNDLNINSKPAWSRDGATIYFHRFVYGGAGATWGIYRTPASGGGALTALTAGATGNCTYPAFLHHAPVVTLSAPAAGAVSGLVAMSASAESAAAIASVRFQVDGVVIATDTTAPFACTWDSSAASPGTHLVQVVASDAVGGTTVSPAVALTVAGPGGGGGAGSTDGGGGSAGGGCGMGGASAMVALLALLLGLRQRLR